MSATSDLIRKLGSLGATAEMIAAAVEAIEAVDEDRRAKRREQKRRERSRDVARQEATSLQVSKTKGSPTPLPKTQPSTPPSGTTYPHGSVEFEEVWKAYPHVKGRSSKRKALAEWAKISTDTRLALPAAVQRYRDEGREPKADCGAPAMERWLRDERYADWISQEPQPKIWTQAEKDAHNARILAVSAAIAQASPDSGLRTMGSDSPSDLGSVRGFIPIGRA